MSDESKARTSDGWGAKLLEGPSGKVSSGENIPATEGTEDGPAGERPKAVLAGESSTDRLAPERYQ